MVIEEDVIEKLKSLGLKEYEAKVYATLVILGPSKASEVARESEVPRPRVYDVLKELHRKGFVDVSEGNPRYFKAVAPEKVIASLRDKYLRYAEEVIIKLRSYRREQEGKWLPIWYLQGEWNIRSNVEDLARRVKKEFLVALTDCRLGIKFREALNYLRSKDINVEIVLLSKSKQCIDTLSNYGKVHAIPSRKILNMKQDDLRALLVKNLLLSKSTYRVKGVFVRDGSESLMIYEEGGMLKGLIIKLPFIPSFQRIAITYLIKYLSH